MRFTTLAILFMAFLAVGPAITLAQNSVEYQVQKATYEAPLKLDPRAASFINDLKKRTGKGQSITKYGVPLYRTTGGESMSSFQIRGGISKLSTKAYAGVEVVLTW